MSKILLKIAEKMAIQLEAKSDNDLKAFKVLAQQVADQSSEKSEEKSKDSVPTSHEHTIQKPQKARPGSYDKQYIQKALVASEDYQQATANGQQFLTFPYMRAYKLRVQGKKGSEELIAFVWDVMNLDVLKFLVEGAKRDMINGIVAYAPNCILVKRYKGAV